MPPPPKHRGRETTAGMPPPPENRLKAPLVESGSRGGALAPPEHHLKAPLVGSDSSGGATAPPPERRGKDMGSSAASRGEPAATGSSGETPLANLSNLIGSPWFPIKQEPPATATQPQRFARERKYTVPSSPSSSSPRDPSVRTGQQIRPANKTCRDTAAALSFRDSATRQRPLEKPGTGLSGGRMPSASLSDARMPSSPNTSLSGARMLPNPRMPVKAGTGGLSIETPRKHQTATSSAQKHHQAVTGSPQKHQAVTSSNRGTAQEIQSVTSSNGETSQKHRTRVTVDGRSSEEVRRKKYRKEKIAPSQTIGQPSSFQRAETITERPTIREKKKQQKSNGEELPAEEKIHLTEEMMKKVQEADDLIQQLNKLGLGEDISNEELQHYFEQLPSEPPRVDTSLELDDEQIRKLQVHHVLCLIKYHKMTHQGHKNDLCDATLEDDYSLYHLDEKLKCFEEDVTKLEGDDILDYLDKEGLLEYFEKDDIFGWSFQYRDVAALHDYQRLVPENYGGCEYVHWNVYRKYFHKYDIELEYLDFWEELSKNLKWMEGYIDIEWPTLKWRRICSRGESQAVKIAAGFKNITSNLAHAAYYELIDSMNVEFCWFKDLDGVYFEIWKQVTKLKKSFREALEVVYKLDKFPLRQHIMEHALRTNDFEMEKEFHNCIEGIPEEVTEENARELIADAITKLRDRPKFYAQYIRKKIEIARAVGVIPTVSSL